MPTPFLLLQARDPDDEMLSQEQRCFADKLGVGVESIAAHNLIAGPPELSWPLDSRAVFIGGSGDYLVSRGNLPRFADTLEYLRRLVDAGHPMFASCFGFQCLVAALGGVIIHDVENAEVGTFEITLTEDGRTDPLLGRLPATFAAQEGHKDRAQELPRAAVHLASSRRSAYQAFRLADRPVWATQFHPELNRDENRERYERYLEHYRGQIGTGPRDEGVSFRESRESETLLAEFAKSYAR